MCLLPAQQRIVAVAYPVTGGVSGNCSRNLPNSILKFPRTWWLRHGVVRCSRASLLQHKKNYHNPYGLTSGLWCLYVVVSPSCLDVGWVQTAFQYHLGRAHWVFSKPGLCSISLYSVVVTSSSASIVRLNSSCLWWPKTAIEYLQKNVWKKRKIMKIFLKNEVKIRKIRIYFFIDNNFNSLISCYLHFIWKPFQFWLLCFLFYFVFVLVQK